MGFLQIMRPKQWTKNLIIYAGLVFSNHLLDINLIIITTIGFFLFCLFSSCVYIINDILDREKDAVHHKKKYRPIPSGKITVSQAFVFGVILFIFSFGCALLLNPTFALVGFIYFLLITLYSFVLKHLVIIDVMTIAMGFILRAVAGTVLIGVRISPWLLSCTLLLSMFLALNKRRSELLAVDVDKVNTRKILKEYSPELVRDMINIVTASTVMAYALYTFTSEHTTYMMVTIPFVIYGVFRYQYILHKKGKKGLGESPELILLKDLPLVLNIFLWVLTCIVILYIFD
ncbi:decaprenyl-phosphate phosphoribosyltransferase [Serpentinicella alkaliphila]|uniref:4-hydroxybenzoate polyprenyltransferase n=1 Tax=Serpentinicella alkaliphila TaxID=1734049 RepID=A0A4R2TAY1_9FIRM|nr:decaprenyl-phosphate phosphoribosyltransferase [Serpentinicella alkaliphila]TCQ00500.1 4-hydroxybenzoate polyprenyltransferase [Serpentinicella alkaliphila]